MEPSSDPKITGLVIPVYSVTGADTILLTFEDVLEYVFSKMAETGESVRLANIWTYGG